MIRLVYIMGGNFRKVIIEGRKITMLISQLNFEPLEIDLDKMSKLSDKDKEKMKDFKEIIEDLRDLTTEEELAKDITKDFQKTGWRKVERNGTH